MGTQTTTWQEWVESGEWTRMDDSAVPMLPTLATEVMRLAMDPDVSVVRLARVIAKEQVLAVKVLRLANSAFCGSNSEIATLNEAIVRTGTAAVRNTVLTVCVSSQLQKASVYGVEGRGLAEHALGTAVLSWLVAGHAKADADEAMVYGLLHDVGKLFLASMRKTFVDGGGAAPTDDGYEAVVRERHPRVGEWMLRRWQLPEMLRQVVLYHHAPEECADYPVQARVVYVANLLSHRYGFGCPAKKDDELLEDPVCKEFGITAAWLADADKRAPGLFDTARHIVA